MSEQRARKISDLPRSAAHCEAGPLLERSKGVVRVRYDTESDDGVAWYAVTFFGVMALTFTPEVSITELMTEAYDRVCEVENSGWLATLRERAGAQHSEIPLSKRHFMIFFDHHGCLEVIAHSLEISDG